MIYWLFHQWAPRYLRLWVWVLIIATIAGGGPLGLLTGIVMGLVAVPMGLFYNFFWELYDWSADNGTLLGSKPSDKLRMSDKYRL